MEDCCKKTANKIDTIFQEGMQQFEIDESGGVGVDCPYSKRRQLERHWWTRGYAYQARLFRAIKAELGK